LAKPEILTQLADAGHSRLSDGALFPIEAGRCAAGAAAGGGRSWNGLTPLCEAGPGIRAVTQLHNNTLIASPGMAYHVLQDLPPEWMGIELDPGNQSFDGLENWDRSARLLGKFGGGTGREGYRRHPRHGAARRAMTKAGCASGPPIDNGVTPWNQVVRALKRHRLRRHLRLHALLRTR